MAASMVFKTSARGSLPCAGSGRVSERGGGEEEEEEEEEEEDDDDDDDDDDDGTAWIGARESAWYNTNTTARVTFGTSCVNGAESLCVFRCVDGEIFDIREAICSGVSQ